MWFLADIMLIKIEIPSRNKKRTVDGSYRQAASRMLFLHHSALQ
jgi:hypothetical protein